MSEQAHFEPLPLEGALLRVRFEGDASASLADVADRDHFLYYKGVLDARSSVVRVADRFVDIWVDRSLDDEGASTGFLRGSVLFGSAPEVEVATVRLNIGTGIHGWRDESRLPDTLTLRAETVFGDERLDVVGGSLRSAVPRMDNHDPCPRHNWRTPVNSLRGDVGRSGFLDLLSGADDHFIYQCCTECGILRMADWRMADGRTPGRPKIRYAEPSPPEINLWRASVRREPWLWTGADLDSASARQPYTGLADARAMLIRWLNADNGHLDAWVSPRSLETPVEVARGRFDSDTGAAHVELRTVPRFQMLGRPAELPPGNDNLQDLMQGLEPVAVYDLHTGRHMVADPPATWTLSGLSNPLPESGDGAAVRSEADAPLYGGAL